MCIQYCHRYIENLYLTLEKQVCNFGIFCNFFACARSILMNFGLETEHLFYVAQYTCSVRARIYWFSAFQRKVKIEVEKQISSQLVRRKSAIKPIVLDRFFKFKMWLIQQNKSHLDLWAFKTMTKFSVAGIDSEKCFGVQKSKFQTRFSVGKADFHCNFEPGQFIYIVWFFMKPFHLFWNLAIWWFLTAMYFSIFIMSAILSFRQATLNIHHAENYLLTIVSPLKCMVEWLSIPFSSTICVSWL